MKENAAPDDHERMRIETCRNPASAFPNSKRKCSQEIHRTPRSRKMARWLAKLKPSYHFPLFLLYITFYSFFSNFYYIPPPATCKVSIFWQQTIFVVNHWKSTIRYCQNPCQKISGFGSEPFFLAACHSWHLFRGSLPKLFRASHEFWHGFWHEFWHGFPASPTL